MLESDSYSDASDAAEENALLGELPSPAGGQARLHGEEGRADPDVWKQSTGNAETNSRDPRGTINGPSTCPQSDDGQYTLPQHFNEPSTSFQLPSTSPQHHDGHPTFHQDPNTCPSSPQHTNRPPMSSLPANGSPISPNHIQTTKTKKRAAKTKAVMAPQAGGPTTVKEAPRLACLLCDEKFVSEAERREHKTEVHMNATYTCIQCRQSFDSEMAYHKHHVTLHHEEGATFDCMVCERRYQTRRGFLRHIQRHHIDPHCPRNFPTKQRLAAHSSVHIRVAKQVQRVIEEASNDAAREMQPCGTLSEDIPGKSFLEKHIQRSHQGINTCNSNVPPSDLHTLADEETVDDSQNQGSEDNIPFTVTNYASYNETREDTAPASVLSQATTIPWEETPALISEYSSEASSAAEEATNALLGDVHSPGEQDSSKSSGKLHGEGHMDTEIQALEADIEDTSTGNAETSSQHPLSTTNTRNCSFCGKQFENKKIYNAHIRKEHPDNRTSSCPCCSREMPRSSLRSHVKKMHGENEASKLKHVCQLCEREFLTSQGLSAHCRVHVNKVVPVQVKRSKASREKQTCSSGSADFPDKHSLEEHIWTEHIPALGVEFPYKCNICKEVFRLPEEIHSHHPCPKKRRTCPS